MLAANPLIEALTDHIRWRAQDRVSLKDLSADALFQQAIATLDMESITPVRSFAIRDAVANAAMVAHVSPIRSLSGRARMSRRASRPSSTFFLPHQPKPKET